MMTNLFSPFDPTTPFMIPLNWSSVILGMLMIHTPMWLLPSRTSMMWFKSLMTLHKEFKLIMTNLNQPGSTTLFVFLFAFILFNNFLGLFPYIFTSTSHLSFTLTLSLPMWISLMLYGWFNNTQHMLAHLMPVGTPLPLMPFMVCIEMISSLIRPGTLAVRLMANMLAGHLLLIMLGSTGPSMTTSLIPLLLASQVLLLMLESAVAIIQSYVFTILLTLYSSETK